MFASSQQLLDLNKNTANITRRDSLRHLLRTDLFVLFYGLLVPLTFSPYDLSWLTFVLYAFYFASCTGLSALRGLWRGWLFGFGQFSWGLYWLHHTFDIYSNIPFWLIPIITLVFAALLAIYPAIASIIAIRLFKHRRRTLLVLALPSTWILFEWLRSSLFTGFPWLLVGYSQLDTFLGGYTPLFGSFGVGFITLNISGCFALTIIDSKARIWTLPIIAAVFLAGWGLQHVKWYESKDDPITVSLIQGNIPDVDKWDPSYRNRIKTVYMNQTLANLNHSLIVYPETAIPNYLREESYYLNSIKQRAKSTGTSVLIGIMTTDYQNQKSTNSIVNLNGEQYNKQHLLPIAEYNPFPTVGHWINTYLGFPMSKITPGNPLQPLIHGAGYPVGTSICFEIAYGSIIRQLLPNAAFLVNSSDDGTYVNSIEPYQSLQVARFRALENARYLLRASNTGFSAIIGPKGQLIKLSDLEKEQAINGTIFPLSGYTPYSKLGDMPTLFIAITILLVSTFWSWFRIWRR